MKTSYKFLAITLMTLLCSCNEEITPDVIESQVQISANITPCVLTRVTEDGNSFTDGDAIKVQNMDRENKNLATYTYSDSTGKWRTTEELYWIGEDSNTFNAWYPSTAAYDSFTIPTDQTSGIADADWMTATTSAKKADGTINLSFNHNLAKVIVTIESWSNKYSENERSVNSLELISLSSVMSYDGSLSGDYAKKWVKAFVAQANTSFVAIIAPATYSSGDDIMQIYVNDSATPLAIKTSSDLKIEAGKAYNFEITVGKNLAEIISSVTIGGWDEEALVPYIDELGIMHGNGVEIDGIIWAPVNCGYHETDFPYGKLYQWGRKYGQGYSGRVVDVDGNPINDNYFDASVPQITHSTTSLDAGQSIENANIFYAVGYSKPNDWLSPQDDKLWNAGTEEKPIKTEYDPCPNGWRVPTTTELEHLCQNYSQWTTNVEDQPGFWFCGSSDYATNIPQVFFPASGVLSYLDGEATSRGLEGHYWSSSPGTNWYYDGSNFLYIRHNYAGVPDFCRAKGCAVRCVRE